MQGNRPEPNYAVCCCKFEMGVMTKLNDILSVIVTVLRIIMR
jgi:hypothetical protein